MAGSEQGEAGSDCALEDSPGRGWARARGVPEGVVGGEEAGTWCLGERTLRFPACWERTGERSAPHSSALSCQGLSLIPGDYSSIQQTRSACLTARRRAQPLQEDSPSPIPGPMGSKCPWNVCSASVPLSIPSPLSVCLSSSLPHFSVYRHFTFLYLAQPSPSSQLSLPSPLSSCLRRDVSSFRKPLWLPGWARPPPLGSPVPALPTQSGHSGDSRVPTPGL